MLTIASEGGLLTSAGYNTVITNYNGSGGGLTLAGNSSLASPDVTVSIGTATLTGDETWTNNGVGFYNGSQNLPALSVATASNGGHVLTIASEGGLLTSAGYNTVITNSNGSGGGLTLAGNSSPVSPGVTVSIGTATLTGDETWTNNGVGNTDPNNPMQNLPALSVGTISNNGHRLTIDGQGNSMVTGDVSGSGSLTKKGSGTLTIQSASLSYSGDTFVLGGVLSLSDPMLQDTSTVTIATGGILDLEFAGSDTVAALLD